MADPMLKLDGIHKRFGDLEVLRGIDLEVTKGEVVCVIGPSGSGKSTMLRCINLLEPPEEGEIYLEGQDVCKGPGTGEGESGWDVNFLRQRVGMVFQQFNLFPHRTALQNVTMAPEKALGRSREEARAKGRRCSNGSASPTSSISTPNGSPAASSSGSRSPARWRWTRI